MRRFVKEYGEYKKKQYVRYELYDRAQKVNTVMLACERGMITDEDAIKSIANIDLHYEEKAEYEEERDGEVLC